MSHGCGLLGFSALGTAEGVQLSYLTMDGRSPGQQDAAAFGLMPVETLELRGGRDAECEELRAGMPGSPHRLTGKIDL